MEVSFSLIRTFAPGFTSSFDEVVIVVPSIMNAGRKASTVMVSEEEGILNEGPMGTM